jgi:hypothetical protein
MGALRNVIYGTPKVMLYIKIMGLLYSTSKVMLYITFLFYFFNVLLPISL